MSESIWNIAELTDSDQSARREARSPLGVARIAEEHFQNRPVRILEIGVFRGGLTKRFRESRLNIEGYMGVDPYLGTEDDPYLGSYWQGVEDATKLYSSAQAMFDEFGWQLFRQRSTDFFYSLDPSCRFDLIYVDGDHRYTYAFWDMCAFFGLLNDDGLLMVDDYANVDVPDVTRAFNDFVRLARSNIERAGYLAEEFRNRGKFVPVSQFTVYVLPVPDSQRQRLDLPLLPKSPKVMSKALSKGPNMMKRTLISFLDASPRKIISWTKRAITGSR